MVIETKRLILRPWEDGDAEELYRYASDPRVGPICGWKTHESVEESLQIIRTVLSEPVTYAVVLKETGKPVGSIGIMFEGNGSAVMDETEAEIGYWIGVPYWGQGLIPEAVQTLLPRCFNDLNRTAVWCGYYDGNEKSKRVSEKCGFKYHHTEKAKLTSLGVRTEHFTYLMKEDWSKRAAYTQSQNDLSCANSALSKVAQLVKAAKFVLFDMDGTLINSIGVWNAVDDHVIRVIRGDGGAADEDIVNHRDEVIRNLPKSDNPYADYCNWLRLTYQSTWSLEEIIAYRGKIAHEFLRTKVDYKPHADQFIKYLKAHGYTLAIASTTNRANMAIYRTQNENILGKAPVDEYFSLILTREDAPTLKPDPEIYKLALERLHADPADCIVFEDALVGVQAAKSAGLKCIAVHDPYSDPERETIHALADGHIDGYGDLLPFLN